jgi:hypothetical protein
MFPIVNLPLSAFWISGVAPDIAATLKKITDREKRTDFWHLVLLGKMSCLRSRHLVL